MVPMILHAGQQRRHRHKEQAFELSGRRKRWMNLENTIETYALPCVNSITNVSLMYEAGHPKLVFCDNLEGQAV